MRKTPTNTNKSTYYIKELKYSSSCSSVDLGGKSSKGLSAILSKLIYHWEIRVKGAKPVIQLDMHCNILRYFLYYNF